MKTREINIGGIKIGNNNRIAIQSMTNTDTRNVQATVEQIKRLEDEGCEIVRVAVLDAEAAEAVKEIKKRITIPLVADIHFDYRLALRVLENGVDKLRINPGNIGDEQRIREVVQSAKMRGVPIRIGVNSGSLEKDILEKHGRVTPQGLVESTMRHVRILEKENFFDIVISIKASSVEYSIQAYTMISELVDYPLHLGITESGTTFTGSIKSAIGIGIVLNKGIGDTIRVSLTDDPVMEIKAAKEILKALNKRSFGVEIVSCPTCGRTQIDMIPIAKAVEEYCRKIDKKIKIAVMGCAVNGPGEAKDADLGIAGGNGFGLIFKKGEILKKVPESEILNELKLQIEECLNDGDCQKASC